MMKTQNSKLKTQNGFTLLEVVVAMAIVGLGVVTLLEIFSSGLRLAARSFEKSQAIAYGREAMEGILARRGVVEGEEQGYLGSKHRWRLQVKALQDKTQLSQSGWELKEIALKMDYQDGERQRQLEMKTLRLVRKKGS